MESWNIYLVTEIMFILATVLCIMGIALYATKKKEKIIRQKYRDIKQQLANSQEHTPNPGNHNDGELIVDFLPWALQDSEARLIKLNASNDAPQLSEQITKLRREYLSAERSSYSARKDNERYWICLENNLSNLLRKIQQSSPANSSSDINKMVLLEDRIDKLKTYQENYSSIENELSASEEKVIQLADDNKILKSGIDRIRNQNSSILSTGLSAAENEETAKKKRRKLKRYSTSEFISRAEGRLNQISENNSNKLQLAKSLLESNANDNGVNAKLKDKIQTLKHAIQLSEDEIKNLNLEISKLSAKTPERSTQASFSVTDTNDEESDDDNVDESLSDSHSKDKTYKHINELRHINIDQRNMIADLKNEINQLKDDLDHIDDDNSEEHDLKLDQIEKLERIIKESEHCISALESEVEQLFEKLLQQNQQSISGDEEADDQDSEDADDHEVERTDEEKDYQEEVEALNAELVQVTEMVNHTMTLYGDQSLLTNFAMKGSAIFSIEEILTLIDKTIRDMCVVPAIVVRTKFKAFQLIPESVFSQEEIKLLSENTLPDNKSQITSDDNVLFCQPNISLAITDFSENPERKTQTKDNLSLLINLASNEISRIESTNLIRYQAKTLNRLFDATKSEIININTHHSYQNTETQSIFESLNRDLDTILGSSELPPDIDMLLQNIKTEMNIRLDILLNSGSILSSGYTKLINSLEKNVQRLEQ